MVELQTNISQVTIHYRYCKIIIIVFDILILFLVNLLIVLRLLKTKEEENEDDDYEYREISDTIIIVSCIASSVFIGSILILLTRMIFNCLT
jgi:hypothetical protein